jgi:hypothetical protein
MIIFNHLKSRIASLILRIKKLLLISIKINNFDFIFLLIFYLPLLFLSIPERMKIRLLDILLSNQQLKDPALN